VVPVEQQEVDNVSVEDAIDHIANRATQNQGQRGAKEPLVAMAPDQPDQQGNRDAAQQREEPALPAVGPGQKTEGRTTVVQQDEVEERQYPKPLAIGEQVIEADLGHLVDHDDDQGQNHPAGNG